VSARASTRRRPRPFPPSTAHVPDLLYRIGRWPDPCSLPPWTAAGLQRLAAFRPPLEADVDTLRPSWRGRRPPLLGQITPDWHRRRAVCRLRVSASSAHAFLDLRALPTLVTLRDVFAALLVDLGLRDLDTSGVRRAQPPTHAGHRRLGVRRGLCWHRLQESLRRQLHVLGAVRRARDVGARGTARAHHSP